VTVNAQVFIRFVLTIILPNVRETKKIVESTGHNSNIKLN